MAFRKSTNDEFMKYATNDEFMKYMLLSPSLGFFHHPEFQIK
jgi:hypothetical protein